MVEYIEERNELDIPGATGIDGYLSAIRNVLELPRVQGLEVLIGKIRWRRFRRPDEPERNVEVDLDTLMPYSIIRTRDIVEVTAAATAAVALGQLFTRAHVDGLNPIALVTGPQTHLHQWWLTSSDVELPVDSVYGLDLLRDPHIGPEALVLCAGFGKRAALVDTIKSYKITMPWRF